MKYTVAFRNSVLRKVIPPESRDVGEVSKETGVSVMTLRNWLERLKSGTLPEHEEGLGAGGRSAVEKFRVVLESQKISSEERGEWLRRHGLHAENLPQFEQELVSIVSEKSDKSRKELRESKLENVRLQRELNRKDKALAEMAALLILKKKADALWGVDEDDSSSPKSGSPRSS